MDKTRIQKSMAEICKQFFHFERENKYIFGYFLGPWAMYSTSIVFSKTLIFHEIFKAKPYLPMVNGEMAEECCPKSTLSKAKKMDSNSKSLIGPTPRRIPT